MKDPHKNTHTSLSRLRGPSYLITKFYPHSVYVRFHRFLANYQIQNFNVPLLSRHSTVVPGQGVQRRHVVSHTQPRIHVPWAIRSIPGCGAIFTRSVNFRVHLRTHKDHKSRHGSSSPSSGPSRTFVKQQLDRKWHDRVVLGSPVSGLQKDRDWTGPRPVRTGNSQDR